MTTLGCSVSNCAYNKEELCCRPDIKVSGQDAASSCETCCSSFLDASGGAQNSISYVQPNTSLDVHCDAESCEFNREQKCGADQISIRPDSGSGSAPEQNSQCESFQPK